MKKIVRGNDLYLRIPVRKSVGGELFAFPLAACEEIHVRLVNSYKRYELSYTIWEKDTEGATLLAKVEGDQLPCGCYALEVRGKLLGNDWRSNEYEQLCFVENNASADTEFEQLDNGEDSVELDTQIVLMGASEPAINPMGEWKETVTYQRGDAVSHDLRCWWAYGQNTASEPVSGSADWIVLVDATPFRDELQAAADNANEAASAAKSATADVEALAKTFTENEAERIEAEAKREENEKLRINNEQLREAAETAREAAEAGRVSAESARVSAESGRADAEGKRVSAESVRESNESARKLSESARTTAEQTRESNESARKTAEQSRVAAESKRETDTATAIKNAETATASTNAAIEKAETAAAKCDTATAKAETAASKADTATANANTAEAARAKAETERVSAESARAKAETARESASATAVSNAETATASAETATKAANEAASKATTAATNADTATAKATASATLADTASAKATAAASDAQSAASNANSAATDATNAATDAKTATGEAERVNAQLDGNTFKVTDREGNTSELDIESLVTSEEVVTVQVKSEVASVSASGVTLSVYINHGTTPTKYTTDSEGKATFAVPIGAYYEIYFPDFADARAISPIGYTATIPTRTIAVTYEQCEEEEEQCYVEVKKHVGTTASAFEGVSVSIKIGDGTAKTYTTDANGQVSFTALAGKTVIVTMEDLKGEGWYAHNGKLVRTFRVYSGGHTEHMVYYQFRNGVFIVDADGGEYLLDEWTAAGKTADEAELLKCVTENLANNDAVVYIGAKELSTRSYVNKQWCPQNVQFPSVPESQTYKGVEHTQLIIEDGEELGYGAPAAEYAVTFSKVIGGQTMTGYLGAANQWVELWVNRSLVDEVLTALYGSTTKLLSDYTANKWTSDQYGAISAYLFASSVGNYSKYRSFAVVPFYAY